MDCNEVVFVTMNVFIFVLDDRIKLGGKITTIPPMATTKMMRKIPILTVLVTQLQAVVPVMWFKILPLVYN
jgi:hypothetical protein